MRQVIQIDDDKMTALKEKTGQKTNTKAIQNALDEYLRDRKIESLRSLLGKIGLRYSNRELEENCGHVRRSPRR